MYAKVKGYPQIEIEQPILQKLEILYGQDGVPQSLLYANRRFDLHVIAHPGSRQYIIHIDGIPFDIELFSESDRQVELLGYNHRRNSEHKVLLAPMPGHVIRVDVEAGQQVQKGDRLLTLEAMKMENTVQAPEDSKIKEIFVKQGQTVSKGDPLLEID